MLNQLARVTRLQGNIERALSVATESLAKFSKIKSLRGIAFSLIEIASIALEQDQFDRATRLLSAADAMLVSRGLPNIKNSEDADNPFNYKLMEDTLIQKLGKTVFAKEWALGQTLNQDQAIAYALENFANVTSILSR